ncbi:MAG: TM2 domain-containing protein [Clostridia bacterium]|nr:TM2 domain-containing protein [Clostridia bacterium]
MAEELKFCKYCGEKISMDAIICPKCGRQVEQIKSDNSQQLVINNVSNSSSSSSASAAAAAAAVNGGGVRYINKWVSFVICLLLGYIGGHKFYEGKIGMGILYLCTVGLCGIGWIVDLVTIFLKPNPYPVYPR